MLFVIFAGAAVMWSLLVIRGSLAARGGGRRAILLASFIAVAAALASIAVDVRSMLLARSAQRSDVVIRIVRRADWWQLEYERNGRSVMTANELHVPIGTAVSLS